MLHPRPPARRWSAAIAPPSHYSCTTDVARRRPWVFDGSATSSAGASAANTPCGGATVRKCEGAGAGAKVQLHRWRTARKHEHVAPALHFFVITTLPEKLRTERIALASPYVPRMARLRPRRSRPLESAVDRIVTGKSDRMLPLKVLASSSNPGAPERTIRT